jgi:glycosyltransferase involved in cell wall biosynthesis
MRILICSSFFPPHYLGGAELAAYRQARMLKHLGHDVRVFSGRLASPFWRSRGVKVDQDEFYTTRVRLSAQDISGTSWDFRSPDIHREFCRVLDEFSPELVHVHNIVGLSLMMIDTCHTRHLPTVVTLHDYWGICFKNTLLKNNGRICQQGGLDCLGCREMLTGNLPLPTPVRNAHMLLSLRKVTRFISPSRYLAEQYAANGIPREKISVLNYGIDVESFTPRPHRHGPLALGFIGHLGKHKGLDVLLQALSLMKEKAIQLLVVGTGEEGEHLNALSRELGLERHVTFHGHVDHQRMATIYQTIDVLIVPSIWPENSPVTITEAMATGIPIIASDIGGIGELVEDGVTGFLVPVRDSQTIAERIQRFLACPELKQEMGQRGLEKLQQHRLQDQVEKIVGVYQEALAPCESPERLAMDVLLYDAAEPWNLAIREMFQGLADAEEKLSQRLLICRADLAEDDIWSVAKLLLVPSPSQQSSRYTLQALRHRVPILVPENAEELKQLCLIANAGLFYGNLEELQECLMLLLSNEPLRQAMGTNGHQFIAGHLRALAVAEAAP